MGVKLVIASGPRNFPATLELPEGEAPFGGLLLFHGSDGFGPQHGALGRWFADNGYVTLMPRWFGPSTPYLHWDGLVQADLDAFWKALGEVEGVDSRCRGLAGASRGGGLALVAASRLTGVAAVIDYFGLTRWCGELGLEEMRGLELQTGEGETLGFTRSITAPIIAFHGEADTVVPVGDTLALMEAGKRFGLKLETHLYPGVEHSFIWPDNDKYDGQADRDARDKTLKFLARNLDCEESR